MIRKVQKIGYHRRRSCYYYSHYPKNKAFCFLLLLTVCFLLDDNNRAVVLLSQPPVVSSFAHFTRRTASVRQPPSAWISTRPTTVTTTLHLLDSNTATSTTTTTTTTSPTVDKRTVASTDIHKNNYINQFLAFLTFCILGAITMVQTEEYLAQHTWPSRQMQRNIHNDHPYHHYASLKGMGYGTQERMHSNEYMDATPNHHWDPPSYNEIMYQHVHVRVPQWKKNDRIITPSWAVHLLCTNVQQLTRLKELSQQYQWELLRAELQQDRWRQDLAQAALTVRQAYETTATTTPSVIGFEWASCAWRHGQCGALADATEALDEIDQLLGVLEPFEINFCFDIVERSLRDMLSVVDWSNSNNNNNNIENRIQDEDVEFYRNLPPYQPHRVFDPIISSHEEEDMRLDDEYVQALQSLRID